MGPHTRHCGRILVGGLVPGQLFSPSSTAVSRLISIGSWRESVRFPVCRSASFPLASARLVPSLVVFFLHHFLHFFFFLPPYTATASPPQTTSPPSSSRFPYARPVASRCCCWVRPRVAVKGEAASARRRRHLPRVGCKSSSRLGRGRSRRGRAKRDKGGRGTRVSGTTEAGCV